MRKVINIVCVSTQFPVACDPFLFDVSVSSTSPDDLANDHVPGAR